MTRLTLAVLLCACSRVAAMPDDPLPPVEEAPVPPRAEGIAAPRAEPGASSTATDAHDALVLAHVCQIEGGWSRVDCAAVYWIGVKRGVMRDEPWMDALTGYSVPYKLQKPRAARISAWPWGDIPGASAAYNRRWRSQRTLALRLVRGEIPDPCPEATDWNDRDSQPHGRLVRVCEGLTANALYMVKQ